MAQIEAIPGYNDVTPRQQVKLYSERIDQGTLANLLHLTRTGKLDIGLETYANSKQDKFTDRTGYNTRKQRRFSR